MSNQDYSTILNGLQLAMSGLNKSIEQGEKIIDSFKTSPGFANNLFLIAETQKNPLQIRIAAISILHRELENAYKMQHFPYDLNHIKNGILNLTEMSVGHKKIMVKLEEVLSILVIKEYPHNWPGLLDHILSFIKDPSNAQKTFTALKVISPIFKAYQHSLEDDRKPLLHLMDQFCPFLEKILLERINEVDEDSLNIVNCILKIFNWMIFMEINEIVFGSSNLKHWLVAIKICIDKRPVLPPPNGPLNWDSMCQYEKNVHLKVKKNALCLLSRITRHITNKNDGDSLLQGTFLANLLALVETVVTQIDAQNSLLGLKGDPSQNAYFALSPKALNEAYQFLNYAFQLQLNFQYMNSAMLDAIIYEVLIYSLQISQFELDFYSEAQVQYIYSSKNPQCEPIMQGKKLSADVINLLAKYDTNFAKQFISFIMDAVAQKIHPRSKVPLTDRLLEGLYYGLEEILDATKGTLAGGVNEIIRLLLLPMISNDKNVFLKTRVFIILTKLHATIDNEEILSALLMSVCGELSNRSSLYCASNAIQALSVLLENERAPDLLKNNISDILSHTLSLMKEIHLDEIVVSLQSVVISFGDEIRPFAKDILNNVLSGFWEIIKTNEELQKDDFEENIEKTEIVESLESCLKSMTEILRLNFEPAFYVDCKSWVVEIFNFMFECKNLRQMFNEVLRLFNVLVMKLPQLDDELIFYFPIICYAYSGIPKQQLTTDISCFPVSLQRLLQLDFVALNLKNDSNISFNGILALLGNFIQKSRAIFFDAKDFYGTTFLKLVFDIILDLASLGIQDKDDYSLIYSVRLLSYIFENCFEQTKSHIYCYQEILRYFSNYLGLQERGKYFKCLVLCKLCILIFLDFEFFLSAAKSVNVLESLIYAFCGNIASFNDEDEKRILLLGLIGMFNVPISKIPNIPLDFLTENVHSIVTFLVLEDMKDKKSSNKNEDFVENNMVEEDDEDDDSWHEDDGQEEDDFDYVDPLETIEPVLELKKSWMAMQSQRPADFQNVINSLPPQKLKDIQDSFLYFENKEIGGL